MVAKGARVVGISTDDVETQRRFKAEQKLPFPLLSDQGGKVSRQYGGTMPVVGVASRTTYVIEQDGRIARIFTGSEALDPSHAIAACPRGRSTP